ncbi:MAG TPA: regulatory iron-sulfur-containing complex subunit RicT [Limnochordales bacterium]|nr:regulatory iron-sulfur-containing complex subunit RicT [Limnochordales bacterium]
MEETIRIVGVRFKRAGKIYYFTPGDLQVSVGDQVLVETQAGVECGEVVIPAKHVPVDDVVQPVRRVLRHVGPAEREQLVANRDSERAAQAFAQERIAARGLPMKLVSVEYTFDRSRLTFFFVAEERVDFRELVKELASRFGCRIEMRQIGVRDQAKEVGGIGVCGRDLCCTTWLGEFAPVSIRMAKDQELSLNPSKLTGQCGRLKCCLKFEADTYRRIRDELPEVGAKVRTPDGTGEVVQVLVARESVAVSLGEGRPKLVSLKDFETGAAAVLTGRLAHGNGAALGNGAASAGEGAWANGAPGPPGGAGDPQGNGELDGSSAAPGPRAPAVAGTDALAEAESTAELEDASLTPPAAAPGSQDGAAPGNEPAAPAAPGKGSRPRGGRGKGRGGKAAHRGRGPDRGDGGNGEDDIPGDGSPETPGDAQAHGPAGASGSGKPRAKSRRRRGRRRQPQHRAPQPGEEAG